MVFSPPRLRKGGLVLYRDDFRQLGRGFLMGGADIIPGVSGGTVALILNIYQRLVTAISRFDGEFLALLKRKRWSEAATHLDLRFLVTLGSGIALGIASLASLMHFLLNEHPEPTYAAFFGLIVASSILVARMVPQWRPAEVMFLVSGAVAAFLIVGLPVTAAPPDGRTYLFFCGAIAICAMILPGISGAFILLIMGKYTDVTGMLKQLLKLDWQLEIFISVGVFCAGCLVGLLGFSKLLKWLLARYESFVLALLCGIMAGSLRKIWPFKIDLTPEVAELKLKQLENAWPRSWGGGEIAAIACAVAAFAFVLIVDALTHGHEHPTHDESSDD
jgi:putative membrane protein